MQETSRFPCGVAVEWTQQAQAQWSHRYDCGPGTETVPSSNNDLPENG